MNPSTSKSSVFLKAILILQFFWCAYLILAWIYPFLTSPLDLNYTSGEILDQIKAALQHQLYPVLGTEPFRVFNYPPLFLKLAALLTKFGLSPLMAGRLLNLAGFIGILIILLVWLKKLKVRNFYVLATLSLAGVGFPLIYSLGQVQLQYLATFFSFWGFYLIRDPKQRISLILSGIVFCIAIYTKQTEVWSAGIAFLWLWCYHRKQSLLFLLSLVATLILYGWALWEQWGLPFWLHLVNYTTGSYSWKNFAYQIAAHLLPWTGFLILSLRVGFKNPDLRKDLRWYIFIGCLLQTWTSVRIGSSLMYFIPVSVAILLWIGPSIEGWVKRPNTWILLCFGFQIILGDAALIPVLNYNQKQLQRRQMTMASVCPMLDSTDSRVFSSEPNLPQACGKSLVLYPFIVSNLMSKGQWSAQTLLEKIEKQDYPVLLMDFNLEKPLQGVDQERWNASLIEALRKHYVLDKHIPPYYLYRPR